MESELISLKAIVAALIFSGIGLLLFFVTFVGLDLSTPRFKLWDELIDKQNVALAVFLGAIAIGISLIVSAAIHG